MIVGSIVKAASLIDARVVESQAGEGVPRQKRGTRCGVVAVVSNVLIVPVPLMDCAPGGRHAGGDAAALTAAR